MTQSQITTNGQLIALSIDYYFITGDYVISQLLLYHQLAAPSLVYQSTLVNCNNHKFDQTTTLLFQVYQSTTPLHYSTDTLNLAMS